MCNGGVGGGGVNTLKTHCGVYQPRLPLPPERVGLLRTSQAKGQTHLQHFKCLPRHKNALTAAEYVNIALIKGLWNRKMPRKGCDPEPVLIGGEEGGAEEEAGDGGVGGLGELRSDSYHRRSSRLRRTFAC